MNLLTSFLLGVLFSIGLSISGMVNPDKVIGFLDITGKWDPALAFVMGGAVGFNLIFFRLILKRKKPFLADSFLMPLKKNITWELVVGSALFGVGWGISGICPGPGIANLFRFEPNVLIFVAHMVLGMILFKVFDKKLLTKGS